MKINCFYCNKDVNKHPVCYEVNRRILINRRRFWETVGLMCSACFEKGELVSLPYLEETA